MQIAVVDNDASLLRSLRIILKRQGYDVRCFTDPVEALRALGKSLTPDVLLVDLVMPEMTGLEFLAASSARLPRQCRKAIITGHAERLSEDDLASADVEALFPKPLDLASISSFLAPPAVRPATGDLAGQESRTHEGSER
jgi:DNA-binding NtrC family response regulator